MKQTAYGNPMSINGDTLEILTKTVALDEANIQELIFRHPECLPISDIDESFNPAIPVCTELNTPVGPLDILMTTPTGEIIIIETKLWRNPEARRIVVAQILDYAKELAKWTYEDLQREINRRLMSSGNILYKIVSITESPFLLEEKDFIDTISRNLFRGKFLLLIVGDGIREGAAGIAEFLETAGHLSFSFGMIELLVYKKKNDELIIMPRTLAKTVELQKITVEIPLGLSLSRSSDKAETINTQSYSQEWEQEKMFYTGFWNELIHELEFDDPGQPLPNPANGQNLYLYLGKNKKVWISAYFMKSKKRIGVYFRCQKDSEGKRLYEILSEDKESIRLELGEDLVWLWEEGDGATFRYTVEDIFDPKNRMQIKEFFKDKLNLFINVLRPRLKDL